MSTMMNLRYLHKRVEDAEGALIAARDALRTAAIREGRSREGLFAGLQFVSRKTAEIWSKQAKRDGYAEGVKQTVRAFEILRDAGGAEAASSGDRSAVAAAIILAGKRRRGEIS
jgi:hypothetical protein